MRNKVDFSELERTRNHGDTVKLGTRPTAFHGHLGGPYESIGDDLRGSLEVRAGGELTTDH